MTRGGAAVHAINTRKLMQNETPLTWDDMLPTHCPKCTCCRSRPVSIWTADFPRYGESRRLCFHSFPRILKHFGFYFISLMFRFMHFCRHIKVDSNILSRTQFSYCGINCIFGQISPIHVQGIAPHTWIVVQCTQHCCHAAPWHGQRQQQQQCSCVLWRHSLWWQTSAVKRCYTRTTRSISFTTLAFHAKHMSLSGQWWNTQCFNSLSLR